MDLMNRDQVERERMVRVQIAGHGIHNQDVLSAMRKVPRHFFVPSGAREYAYVDSPVRIGNGQTISQPYIVALMTELLDVRSSHKVLDVGTGSGYQAAILGELAGEVHSIERHAELAKRAADQLTALEYRNVYVHIGDGTLGYIPESPYDRILVAAAAPYVPEPLLSQLRIHGRLILPVGSRYSQQLEVWERLGEETYDKKVNIPVVFVPLIGEAGWEA